MINDLVKNRDDIFDRLRRRRKDVERYFFIKKEFHKGNILNNPEFQKIYKTFYVMNAAGLTPKFFEEYFKTLSSREMDLKKILDKLYEIPRRNKTKAVHFSFTTKLLHTVNNNLPIYDSLVGKAFGLKVKGQHKDAKINSCIKIYEKLKLYYKELLSNDKIKKIILDFRKEFGCNSKKLSDTKILDFLIWANEQLRNKSMKKILKTKNGIILKDYIGYLMTGCNDKLLEFIKERGGSPKIFMKIINKEFLRALKRKDVIINMPKNRKIFMEWQWRKKRFKEPAEFVIHCINEYNKISKINPKKSR